MSWKSCQTNLFDYLNTLTKLVDEGYDVDVIYLDFTKAFEKVPYRRLLLLCLRHTVSFKMKPRLADRKITTICIEWKCIRFDTCFLMRSTGSTDEVLDLVDGFISKFADDT